MKPILIFLLLTITGVSYAQQVGSFPLDSFTVEYIEISPAVDFVDAGSVYINDGRMVGAGKKKDNVLRDDNFKRLRLGIAGTLNLLAKYGYHPVMSFNWGASGDLTIILRKEKHKLFK